MKRLTISTIFAVLLVILVGQPDKELRFTNRIEKTHVDSVLSRGLLSANTGLKSNCDRCLLFVRNDIRLTNLKILDGNIHLVGWLPAALVYRS